MGRDRDRLSDAIGVQVEFSLAVAEVADVFLFSLWGFFVIVGGK